MSHESPNIPTARTRNLLANERTFLSWIRTSLGIMAFGFVVEKFALFIKQIAVVLSKQNLSDFTPPSTMTEGTATRFGVMLIGFGAIIGLFAFIKYRKTIKQINQGIYSSSSQLAGILTIAILAIGAFLIYSLAST